MKERSKRGVEVTNEKKGEKTSGKKVLRKEAPGSLLVEHYTLLFFFPIPSNCFLSLFDLLSTIIPSYTEKYTHAHINMCIRADWRLILVYEGIIGAYAYAPERKG